MIGRRVYPNAEGQLFLAEGDYGRERDGKWVGRPPGHHAGSFGNHQVTEHEDGTITVSPSILLTDFDQAGNQRQWHGYLERGVWRSC